MPSQSNANHEPIERKDHKGKIPGNITRIRENYRSDYMKENDYDR
jgi:hypothetical protein